MSFTPPFDPGSVPERSLETLMEAYCAGDLAAFDELFHRAAPRVRAVLRCMARNPVLADDLTQITFLKVHRGRDTWVRGAPVMPWLTAIARRTYFDARRAMRHDRTVLTPEGDLPEPPFAATPGLDALDALSEDEQRTLQTAMDNLPSTQREALQMLKIDGLSLKDVARITGVSVGAVKVRLHRAYTALRHALGVDPGSRSHGTTP